jgi:hypothetical protein
MSDDSDVLLGTEQKIEVSIDNNSLMAITMRDIFDKKVAQKIMRFFFYGFPEDSLQGANKWLSIPKVNTSPKFSQLYHGKQVSTTELVEECLERNCFQQ